MLPVFLYNNDSVLRELGPHQICQDLRACMVAGVYALNHCRSKKLVEFLFRNRMAAVALLNEVRFFQSILNSNRRNFESSFVIITTPTIFEVIISFHYLSVFNHGLQKKTLPVPQNYSASTIIGFRAQRLLKACKKLFIG